MLAAYFAFFACLFFRLTFPTWFGQEIPADLVKDGSLIRAVKILSLLSIPILLSFFPLICGVARHPGL